MKKEKYDLTETGRRIGLSRTTVRRRIDQGLIRAEVDTDSGFLVVDSGEVERYLAQRWRPYTPPVNVTHTADTTHNAEHSQSTHDGDA